MPNESETMAPIRALLKEDAAWSWEVEHTQSLNKVKAALATEPVLRYYDVSKPVTIQADASQSGLGCCLLQEGRPVHYASRSMTDTEKNYAQIEKELVAICYACHKFHHIRNNSLELNNAIVT